MEEKGKKYYVRHNFVLGFRIQFLRSISACLIVHAVESGGMLRKRGTGNKHGPMKNKRKMGTKERIGKLMKSLFGLKDSS